MAQDTGSTGCAGCFTWWIGLTAGALLLIFAAGFIAREAGWWEEDEIRIVGTVETSDRCIEGRSLAINGARRDLTNGTPSRDGCEYTFVRRIPESDSYTFRLDSEPEIVRRHSLIDTVGESGDTELRVRLSW